MAAENENIQQFMIASNELISRQNSELEQLTKQAEAATHERTAWAKFAELASQALVDNRYITATDKEQVKKALATPERCGAIFKELAEHNFGLRQKVAASAPVQAEAAKKSAAALARAVDYTAGDEGKSANPIDDVIANMAARIRVQGR